MSDYNSSLPVRTENAGDVIVKVADASVPSQQLAIDSNGKVSAKLNDGSGNSLSSTNGALHSLLKDSSGNNYSESNPLPVVNMTSVAGTERHDYSTAAAVAAGATSNHDYTVADTKLVFKGVLASGSGKMKIEIQIDPDGLSGYTTKFVAFNSTATPNMDIVFAQFMELVSGAKIRVIRTNKDNQAQDVYSTIMGLGI